MNCTLILGYIAASDIKMCMFSEPAYTTQQVLLDTIPWYNIISGPRSKSCLSENVAQIAWNLHRMILTWSVSLCEHIFDFASFFTFFSFCWKKFVFSTLRLRIKLKEMKSSQQGSHKSVKTHLLGFVTSWITKQTIFVRFEKKSIFFKIFFRVEVGQIRKIHHFCIFFQRARSVFSERNFFRKVWKKLPTDKSFVLMSSSWKKKILPKKRFSWNFWGVFLKLDFCSQNGLG